MDDTEDVAPQPHGLTEELIDKQLAALQCAWGDAEQTVLLGNAHTFDRIDEVAKLLDAMGADFCTLHVPEKTYTFQRSHNGERLLNCHCQGGDDFGGGDGDDWNVRPAAEEEEEEAAAAAAEAAAAEVLQRMPQIRAESTGAAKAGANVASSTDVDVEPGVPTLAILMLQHGEFDQALAEMWSRYLEVSTGSNV